MQNEKLKMKKDGLACNDLAGIGAAGPLAALLPNLATAPAPKFVLQV